MLQRLPIKRPINNILGGASSIEAVMPAPTGGWNQRDSLDAMPPSDAVLMDNWFPKLGKVVSRPGYTEHCDTGTSTTVESLLEYEYAGAHDMIAVTNGVMYEVSSGTASSKATGLTTGTYWVGTQFGDRLIMCNGTDNAKSYNGATVADDAHTGLTLASWAYVHVHGSRLYIAEKDTANYYYSGVAESASGTLSSINLAHAGIFRGNLEIITSISRDGGAGPDDYIAFISTAGDVLVFQGTDPGDASGWAKVGEYRIGRPLGRRATIQADSDVFVLTNRGYESLARSMVVGDSIRAEQLLSFKIQNIVQDRIAFNGQSDKWSVNMYPLGQMMIVTVPRTGGTVEQHVMNSNTGAWCRFTIDAQCWLQCGNDMYFADSAGKIYKFDDGAVNDAGTAIATDLQTAWTFLGYRGRLKKLNFIRQSITYSILPAVRTIVGVNFNGPNAPTDVTIAADASSGYAWDDAGTIWDVATWAPEGRTSEFTYKERGLGYSFSQRVQISTSIAQLEWGHATYIFEIGHRI